MTYRRLGNYDVLANLETPECSLRLLKLDPEGKVEAHHHHKTTQTYFVIQGNVEATMGSQKVLLEPHQILRIPLDTVHSIRSQGQAIVLSISIPPLEPSDQHVAAQH